MSHTECLKCGAVTPRHEIRTEHGFTQTWLVEIEYCPLCGRTLDKRRTRIDRIKPSRWGK